MKLLLENSITGCIGSVMGDRYVISERTKNILYIDANHLYGHSMSHQLHYDGIKFHRKVFLEDRLYTTDDSDIGYFDE